MSIVSFSVLCKATYKGELEIPESIDATDRKAVLEFVRNNLEEVPVEDLEFLEDLEREDAVTEDDIIEIW